MIGVTIKQIADELRVSKQAVWQRVKRSKELSAMLQDHSETINGTIHVDDVLEQRIKELYPERNNPETVDETTVNNPETVDETSDNVDVNILIGTLQRTVDTLQQQLTAKDKQIDELTAMLKASQNQQATLVTALSAAQALHAGTLQERLADQSGEPHREAAVAEDVSVTEDPAPEPEQTEEQPKLKWWQRLIRRS